MRTVAILIGIGILWVCAGCEPPMRIYDTGDLYAPQPMTPPPPAPVVVDAPPYVEPPEPASSMPGFYSCGDACALASAGACLDLPEHCGLDCGSSTVLDLTIDDPCAPFALELVATPLAPPDSCGAALWIEEICGGAWAAYCCTPAGEPIDE